MKKSFMEILVESMQKAGQEFVGEHVAQDADGTFNFFYELPKRKLKTHHWDTPLGSICSIKGVQLYNNWHGAKLSRVAYENYVAWRNKSM